MAGPCFSPPALTSLGCPLPTLSRTHLHHQQDSTEMTKGDFQVQVLTESTAPNFLSWITKAPSHHVVTSSNRAG